MTFPFHSRPAAAGSSVSFARTQLASTSVISSSSNLATSPFTPGDNTLLVAAVLGSTAIGAGFYTPSVSDSGGHTWTRKVNNTINIGSNQYMWGDIWIAPVTAGASITVTLANAKSQDFISLAVVQYTGANATQDGVSGSWTVGNSNTTPSLTLSGAPAASSEVISALSACTHSGSTVTGSAGSGWTELINEQKNTYYGREIQARSSSTSTGVAWGKSINFWGAVAVALEIKPA